MENIHSNSQTKPHPAEGGSWFIALAVNSPVFIALFFPLHPNHPLVKIAQSLSITTSVVFLSFFAILAIIVGTGIKYYKLNSNTTPFEVRRNGALVIGICLGIVFFASRLFFFT